MRPLKRIQLLLLGATGMIGGFTFGHAQISLVQDPVLMQSPLVSEAYTLLESGDSSRALDHFKQALTENESDLSALLGQAMILADMQRHPEAFATYDNMVKNYPLHDFAVIGRVLAAFNLE